MCVFQCTVILNRATSSCWSRLSPLQPPRPPLCVDWCSGTLAFRCPSKMAYSATPSHLHSKLLLLLHRLKQVLPARVAIINNSNSLSSAVLDGWLRNCVQLIRLRWCVSRAYYPCKYIYRFRHKHYWNSEMVWSTLLKVDLPPSIFGRVRWNRDWLARATLRDSKSGPSLIQEIDKPVINQRCVMCVRERVGSPIGTRAH